MITYTSQLAEVIWLVLAGGVTTAALLVGMRAACLTKHDALRFELFAVRDELARLAIDGKISTEHALYKELVSFLNSTLACTDVLGLREYGSLVEGLRARNEIGSQRMKQRLRTLDPETAHICRTLAMRSVNTAIKILEYNSVLVRLDVRGQHWRYLLRLTAEASSAPAVEAARTLRAVRPSLEDPTDLRLAHA